MYCCGVRFAEYSDSISSSLRSSAALNSAILFPFDTMVSRKAKALLSQAELFSERVSSTNRIRTRTIVDTKRESRSHGRKVSIRYVSFDKLGNILYRSYLIGPGLAGFQGY